MSAVSVIDVRDLTVRFASDHGEIEAVDAASFDVREGEILGLVGESGSGKTVTATAILRLIRKPGRQTRRQHPVRRPRPVAAVRGRAAADPRRRDRA